MSQPLRLNLSSRKAGVYAAGVLWIAQTLPLRAFAQATPPPAQPPAAPPPQAAPAAAPPPATPPTATPPTATPPAAPLPTAPSAASDVDPAAKAILTQFAAAQSGLKSYSASIDTTVEQGAQKQALHADVAYALPNKVNSHVSIGPLSETMVSDGAKVFATGSDKPKSYLSTKADPGAANIAQTLASSHASVSNILPLLVTQNDAASALVQGASSATKLPDETLDNVPVDVIKVVTPHGGSTLTTTFAIGKEDHLLRRFTMAVDQGNTRAANITETYARVQANPTLAAGTFTFTPAPGMTLAKAEPPPSAAGGDEETFWDKRLKPGAKPFAFNAKDLVGKSVNLAAYRGKVVLLDFWATWCPPCVEEVPNVVATYKKYHAQGFEIVGVSLDNPGDLGKLVSFTKDHGMAWRQIYDGKSFDGKLPTQYGIKGIPFMLLIGKDGRISAIEPRGDALAVAVKKALAAK